MSMSAWALRQEKVYLQMTGAHARLEQTADSTEPDWHVLYERQKLEQMEHWSGSWRAYQGRETSESVDGDDDTAREAHSWSEHDDVDEMRLREMEERVKIPAHGQSTKDCFLDVIRGLSWC